MDILNKIEIKSDTKNSTTIITVPCIHLDDSGETTTISELTRFFRNIDEIRYFGKVHESITTYGYGEYINYVTIIHTGYTTTEHREKKKSERNIELLRIELKEKPDDITVKAYLAGALDSKNSLDDNLNEQDKTEIEALYKEVAESDCKTFDFLKKNSFIFLIGNIWFDQEKKEECEALCRNAYESLPGDMDICYYYAVLLNNKKNFTEAWEVLRSIEPKMINDTGHKTGTSMRIQSDPTLIFGQMLLAAQGLGNTENMIKYATILLSSDKNNHGILGPYIHTLLKNGVTEDKVMELLMNIYNMNDPGDLLFIARTAKEYGAIEFARMIISIAGELNI